MASILGKSAFNSSGSAVRRLGVGGVAALGALAVAVWGSWYTVPEGYRGVITRNGALVGVAEPGLGFKVPLIDDVIEMSVQTQKVAFDNISSYSKDIQVADNRVAVNYRLPPDKVEQIYREIGVGYADRVIFPIVQKRYKEVFGSFSAVDVVGKRELLGDRVTQAIREELEPYGVIVDAVQIENIDFSDTYEAAVEAAAEAEADVKRANQELAKSQVDAQKQVAEAKARAEARKATADAEAYATRAAADADAYAMRARGEADAAAIQVRGEALRENPDLIRLIAAERWNGSLPTTMVPGSAMPFIELKTNGAP